MHELYDPTDTTATWAYCPACERMVQSGVLGYVGSYAYKRHWLDPYAPVGERDRCLNSGWPVRVAFFRREDGRMVTREEWEAGWAHGDPAPADGAA